jgi:hypothetical protein
LSVGHCCLRQVQEPDERMQPRGPWTQKPTGALVGAGSLWPLKSLFYSLKLFGLSFLPYRYPGSKRPGFPTLEDQQRVGIKKPYKYMPGRSEF